MHLIVQERGVEALDGMVGEIITMIHILKERKRVAERSRIGDMIFGGQDGVTTAVGVLSSMFGAAQSNSVILIAGFATTIAGMFSMAAGSYLASRAELDVHRAEILKETEKIRDEPENELMELIEIYERQGMSRDQAADAANAVMKKPEKVLELMAQIELGVDPQPSHAPVKDALLMGGSFVLGGVVPLFPYFFLHGKTAFFVSVFVAVFGLFAMGAVKGKITGSHVWRSGIETFLVGSLAAGLGFAVGTLIPKALGVGMLPGS